MNTRILIAIVGSVILAAVVIIGIILIGMVSAADERERYERSWDSCSQAYDNLDDVIRCHDRNVSD